MVRVNIGAILGAFESLSESTAFTVPGRPRGKGRPRAAYLGGHVRMYTDRNTVEYEREIAKAYRAAGGDIHDGPVSVFVHCVFPVPQSVNKRTREMMLSGEMWPNNKPDGDNVLKAVLDGLNKVAYHDDTQVGAVVLTRAFGEEGCVQVEIMDLEGRLR